MLQVPHRSKLSFAMLVAVVGAGGCTPPVETCDPPPECTFRGAGVSLPVDLSACDDKGIMVAEQVETSVEQIFDVPIDVEFCTLSINQNHELLAVDGLGEMTGGGLMLFENLSVETVDLKFTGQNVTIDRSPVLEQVSISVGGMKTRIHVARSSLAAMALRCLNDCETRSVSISLIDIEGSAPVALNIADDLDVDELFLFRVPEVVFPSLETLLSMPSPKKVIIQGPLPAEFGDDQLSEYVSHVTAGGGVVTYCPTVSDCDEE